MGVGFTFCVGGGNGTMRLGVADGGFHAL